MGRIPRISGFPAGIPGQGRIRRGGKCLRGWNHFGAASLLTPRVFFCPPQATEACCELCGLYFENRKALASHARAHLRQFGVTEWCVNGSPIETLSEWIRHRPQKAGAYRSYIQGGRPFTKKFRNSAHAGGARRVPLGLQGGAVALLGKGLPGDLAHGDAGKLLDGGSGTERPLVTSPLSLVKLEEHQRSNISSESGGPKPLQPGLTPPSLV